MKKILIAFSLLMIVQGATAQEEEAEAKVEPQPARNRYTVKWNPASLAFGKLGLSGEYSLKPKRSITFGIGIPMESSLNVAVDDAEDDLSIKTFSVMAGYRMYLGRKPMTGAYFEPYLKYVKNDLTGTVEGELDNSPTTFVAGSSYKGMGLGAQLGVQFMIAKRVVFDFFFLGPEANVTKHTFSLRDITTVGPWDAQDAADAEKEIRDALDEIPVLRDKLDVTVDAASKTVSSHYKGFLPGFRFGLTIGVHF